MDFYQFAHQLTRQYSHSPYFMISFHQAMGELHLPFQQRYGEFPIFSPTWILTYPLYLREANKRLLEGEKKKKDPQPSHFDPVIYRFPFSLH